MERPPEKSASVDWAPYIKTTENGPVRSELVRAIEFVKYRDRAADLGAGALNEARFLLDQGFSYVLAIDAAAVVAENAENIGDDRLEVRIGNMQDAELLKESFDIISAQSSLYFVPPSDLLRMMSTISKALKPGGIFTAQFLGPNDGWRTISGRYTQSGSEIRSLLEGFEIVSFQEREEDRGTALNPNGTKHWHTFNILARKNNA